MDDNRSRSTSLIVIALAIGGLYLFQTFAASPPEEPAEGPAEGEVAAPVQDDDGAESAPPPPRQLTASERQARVAAWRAQRQTATIRTEHYLATIDNLGGGLMDLLLLNDERFEVRETGEPLDLLTTNDNIEASQSFRLTLPGAPIPADAVWDIEQVSEREVKLTYAGQGLRVERTFRAGDGPYQLWSSFEVTNTGRSARSLGEPTLTNYHYVRRDEEGGGGFLKAFIPARSAGISSALCANDGEVWRKDRSKLVEEAHAYRPETELDFVAVENVYFAQALAPTGEVQAARCAMLAQDFDDPEAGSVDGSRFESRLVYPATELAPGESTSIETLGYFGPKIDAALQAAGHELPQLVNLGWFAVISRQLAALLALIHGFVGNWGLAIIVLTVLVKLVLAPLTIPSLRSMARMRQLKPETDVINEKYKDDPEGRMRAIQEVYRKHGVGMASQLGGCLPMLLQMPIFWALYMSLSTNIELYHMPFALWWTDLTAPDPYLVLPILYGVMMHVQQRFTPTSMDPAQARIMMYMMPGMLTVFFLVLPAGLILYFVTNLVLSFGQQQLIEWNLRRRTAAAAAGPATTSSAPPDAGDETDPGDDATVTNPSPKGPRKSRRPVRRQRRPRRG